MVLFATIQVHQRPVTRGIPVSTVVPGMFHRRMDSCGQTFMLGQIHQIIREMTTPTARMICIAQTTVNSVWILVSRISLGLYRRNNHPLLHQI